jgi:hypothetical protein
LRHTARHILPLCCVSPDDHTLLYLPVRNPVE